MKELHALVDFENVQPTLDELAKLAPGFTDVWLFHGPHQAKQAQQLADAHSRVTLIPRSGKGKNALDFHLSFYLGYVAAKHPLAELVVVANDKGYDPMIVHARLLGFTAKRVGYKAKPEPVAKAAPAKKAVAVKVPAPAGKAATPAAPAKAVAKKARVKKVAATNVPAVKAPTPKAPAKKAVAKKATPQQAAAKKVAPKPPANNVSTPAKAKPVSVAPAVAPSPEAKTLARIQKGLLKMGNQAPQIDLVTTSALENPAVIAVVNESRRAVYESAHKSGDEVRDKLADLNLKVADVADAVVWARISHERSV